MCAMKKILICRDNNRSLSNSVTQKKKARKIAHQTGMRTPKTSKVEATKSQIKTSSSTKDILQPSCVLGTERQPTEFVRYNKGIDKQYTKTKLQQINNKA